MEHQQRQWREYSSQLLVEDGLIRELYASAGYGRGIHAFKNLVLRRDRSYASRAREDLDQALEAGRTLQGFDNIAVKATELEAILGTFAAYRGAIDTAERMIVEGASVEDIDKVVRIDDTPAERGLASLSAHIDAEARRATAETDRAISRARWSMLAIYLCFALAGLFVVQRVSSRLVQRVRDLNAASRRIAGGDLNTRVVLEGTGELQELASDMEAMRIHLQRTVESLMRSNADLDRFAYTASHDLQEPARRIRLAADLVERQIEKGELERINKSADILRRSGVQMQKLISDILDYSRAQSANVCSRVDLNEIAGEVMDMLANSIDESGAEVSIARLPTIEASPIGMRQVLLNLLGNAIRFRHPSRAPEIHLESSVDEGNVTLEVRDNGLGFDMARSQDIFLPFQRLHQGIPGTGIGLSLCKRVVEQHGGSIEVESEPDRGSVFYVHLPVDGPVDGRAPASSANYS